MMNSWPPISGTTTGFNATQTTVQWGTDGLLQSPKPGGSGNFYVVSRFRQSPKKEEVYLSNGTGIEVNRIKLRHGQRWELAVRDDSTMTPPDYLATVVITDAAGMVHPNGNGSAVVGAVYTAAIIDTDWESSMKNAGERILVVENLTLVDNQAAGSPQ